jgi:hypothetical protein
VPAGSTDRGNAARCLRSGPHLSKTVWPDFKKNLPANALASSSTERTIVTRADQTFQRGNVQDPSRAIAYRGSLAPGFRMSTQGMGRVI